MKGLKSGSIGKRRFFWLTFFALALAGILSRSEAATTYTLSQNSSSAQINVANTGSNPAGMFNWLVDGVNQMHQQWFYYRVGNDSGPASSIDSITGSPTVQQLNSRNLNVTYANSDYSIKVSYLFTGGLAGSGYAQIGETITILNKSTTSSLDLHFFNYADFDLADTSSGQSIQFNGNTSGLANSFTQTMGDLSAVNTLNSGLASPTHVEAAMFDQTLSSITSGSRTHLNDELGAGVGNVTGAWEWDVTLAPAGQDGDGFQISSGLILHVPEPSTLSLLVLGLIGWAAVRKSRV